jgi:hypothetical protein
MWYVSHKNRGQGEQSFTGNEQGSLGHVLLRSPLLLSLFKLDAPSFTVSFTTCTDFGKVFFLFDHLNSRHYSKFEPTSKAPAPKGKMRGEGS